MIDDGGIVHGGGMAGALVEIAEEQIGLLWAQRFAMLGIAHNIGEQGDRGCHLRQSAGLPSLACGTWPLALLRKIETMLMHG